MNVRVLVLVAAIAALAVGLPFAVAGISAPGDQLWVSRYNGPASGSDGAYSIGVSPDASTVFVTGGSDGSGGPDYATVAYASVTGAQTWTSRYDGPAAGFDFARAVGVDPDGSKVFVTGQSQVSAADYDYATIAYDSATGAQLWAARYNGDPGDDPSALGVSPNGSRVFVTGQSGGDYATVAYDAATGAQLWATRYSNRRGWPDFATALGVSPDGTKVYVTGGSQGRGSLDYATVAYDAATGAQLWVARYDAKVLGDDIAQALAVAPDGSKVFVTGQSVASASGNDYLTIAYDAASGARLWVKRYDGPGSGYDIALALVSSPNGARLFVTGASTGSSSGFDYATLAYDAATGARQWLKRYKGVLRGDDYAQDIGVAPNGSTVFVTGRSGKAGARDYATLAYDAATGAQQWVTRYDGPANGDDRGSALGASPDGSKVFVTGQSTGSGTSDDYATVAYSTG
jgi:WD40 repeat protein